MGLIRKLCLQLLRNVLVLELYLHALSRVVIIGIILKA